MRRGFAYVLLVVWCACLWPVVDAVATEEAADHSKEEDPIFIRWLVPGNPSDETILHYWQRARQDELSAAELVDLGTMLFNRGYPKDAVRMFRAALDLDSELYEAWFRIGLVEHREGNMERARQAYRKCLKKLTGHGWCNFYMGLLEEQTNHPSKALEYYRRAFKFAPELSDPEINPELLYSKLQFGAAVLQRERERFTETVPMPYLEPRQVRRVRSSFEPTPAPTPTSTPVPEPAYGSRTQRTPTPSTAGASTSGTGVVVPGTAGGGRVRPRSRPPSTRTTPTPRASTRGNAGAAGDAGATGGDPGDGAGSGPPSVGQTSPEASLPPLWRGLPEAILYLV